MSLRSRKNGENVLPFPGHRTSAVAPAPAFAPLLAPVPGPLLPALIVLHQEHSTPGRVGYSLQRLGYRLDVRRPRFGDPLPQTMRDHAAAVIFGGPMSANDEDEFIRREIDWTTVPLNEDKPFLGICLGAQMFARALGAQVLPHPEGQAEIGYYPIRPTVGGARAGQRLARAGLSVAPRRLRAAALRRAAGRRRHVRGAGLPVSAKLCAAISPRRNPRDDAPLDDARTCAPGNAGRKAPRPHFADRAMHDFAERAWLKRFIDGWLTRMPRSIMSEAAE